jgi:peptide/nickel transport system substrate-binding protein
MYRKLPRVAGALAALAGVVATGAQPSSASRLPEAVANVPFTMTTEASGPFPKSFNPFITSTYAGYVNHLIYEPLYQLNYAKLQPIPWLATSYTWSNGGKTMTFDIRPGVQWSNGTPFSAADVAFTFNLMKKNPAANVDALPIASATAPSATKAVVNFSESSYSQIYNILSTLIVSQAIWSKVPDPATYTDPNPVGTGPYVLSTFTPQVITMTANPHYWQPGLPKIQTVQAVQEDSSASTEAALDTGTVDWSADVFPDHTTMTKAFPNLKVEAFPFVDVPMVLNFTKYPLNLLPVRQAISEALDRPAIVKLLAPYLDTPMNNKTALVGQSMGNLIAPQFKNATFRYSPSGAQKLLEKAGFKRGSGGIFVSPNGKPLQLSLMIPSSYPNWVAISPVIQSELKAAGIGMSIQLVAETTYAANAALGDFDLTLSSQPYENPYGLYDFYLGSSGTAPIGHTATTDWGRYMDSTTQQLLTRLNGTLPGSAAAATALARLESVVVTQTPFVPIFVNSQWGVYNSNAVTGYPTASNLYAFPSEINTEVILLHLRSVRK